MGSRTKSAKTRNVTGLKLRALRRMRRLTQAELAEKTGLSPTTINNLERGKHEPSTTTLRLLDEALGQQVETVVLDEAS